MYNGKNSKVSGKHNTPNIIHGNIQQQQVIHIQGHEHQQVTIQKKAFKNPSISATTQPIIDGMIRRSIMIKQIIPKQNTT